MFAGDLNVTIRTYTDNVLGFGLTVWDPAANVPIDVPLVNYTLIPLDYCDGDGGDAEPHPLNRRCLYNTSLSVAQWTLVFTLFVVSLPLLCCTGKFELCQLICDYIKR